MDILQSRVFVVGEPELRCVLNSQRVDFNKDRSVSAKEMQQWIMEKTEEHFQEANHENKNSFHAVDPDGDGERENDGEVEEGSGTQAELCPQVM